MRDIEQEIPLIRALSFTEDDLQANRQGKLSTTQVGMLSGRMRQQMVNLFAVIVVAAVVAGALLATVLSPLVAGLLAVGLVIVVGVMGYRRIKARGDAVAATPVRRVEGRCQKAESDRGLTVTIGDRSFTVNQTTYAAFVNGGEYAVYVLDDSSHILSGERLDDNG